MQKVLANTRAVRFLPRDRATLGCEDRVRDGPASGEKGSKGESYIGGFLQRGAASQIGRCVSFISSNPCTLTHLTKPVPVSAVRL
jgi:hypothetical protein